MRNMLVSWNQLTDRNLYKPDFFKHDFPSKLFKHRNFMSSKTIEANCC